MKQALELAQRHGDLLVRLLLKDSIAYGLRGARAAGRLDRGRESRSLAAALAAEQQTALVVLAFAERVLVGVAEEALDHAARSVALSRRSGRLIGRREEHRRRHHELGRQAADARPKQPAVQVHRLLLLLIGTRLQRQGG